MTVTITIKCDNAAFREDDDTGDNSAAIAAEVARILIAAGEYINSTRHSNPKELQPCVNHQEPSSSPAN